MMVLNIDPRIDLAFKKLFGVEENKDLLISLINATLSPEDQIVDLEILNPYQFPNSLMDRASILDVKARSTRGQLFNIEIQVTDEGDYDKRALYYWSKLYVDQLKQGTSFSTLNKAIGIHILNFTSILETNEYHNVFRIFEHKKFFPYFKDLELHTIELSKFARVQDQLPDLLKKIHTSLDRWTLFLARNDLLNREQLPEQMKSREIEKALGILEVMSMTPLEKEQYEGRVKWMLVEESALRKAENKGLEKGIEQGRQEGLEKGIKQGRQEGFTFMIQRMLEQERSVEEIAQWTGLTVQEVQAIKSKIKI